MCIVVGKYYSDYGWVAIKHRDRNYSPDVTFKKKFKHGVEILYFWDNITQWCEGINSKGISILSASLMVSDDEKEYVTCSEKKPSKTGIKIRKALKKDSIEDVVEYAIAEKLTGNTLIFNAERMFLLEGAWKPGEYATEGYYYEVREIDRSDIVVRTNHGIWLPNTGYQHSDSDAHQTFNRKSSESRFKISTEVAHNTVTPFELLDELANDYTRNGQLNPFRTAVDLGQMHTTAQLMIIPSEFTFYIRNVEGKLKVDISKIDQLDHKLWVEFLSQRSILPQKPAF